MRAIESGLARPAELWPSRWQMPSALKIADVSYAALLRARSRDLAHEIHVLQQKLERLQTVQEQTVQEQTARFSDLPAELVVELAHAHWKRTRHRDLSHIAMMLTCHAWQRALSSTLAEGLWRDIAISRFPRLEHLVRELALTPPSWRELHCLQLRAEEEPAPFVPLATQLSDYVFSFEVWTGEGSRLDGQWVGRLDAAQFPTFRDMPPDPIYIRLWTEATAPEWALPTSAKERATSVAEDSYDEWAANVTVPRECSCCRLSILVSRLFPDGVLRTVRLADVDGPDDFITSDHGGSWENPALVFSTVRLPEKISITEHTPDNESGVVAPVRAHTMDIVFTPLANAPCGQLQVYPWLDKPDDDEHFNMSADDFVCYLEPFLNWG